MSADSEDPRPPDRPFVGHQGQRYERFGGTWRLNNLSVPLSLQPLLDRIAKAQPELWEACQRQDFDDDPRNRHRLWPPAGFTADEILRSAGAEPPQRTISSRTGKQSKKANLGLGLDWHFENEVTLVLSADIQEGWRETKTGWRFHSSVGISVTAAASLHVAITVVENDWVADFRRREWRGKPTDSVTEPLNPRVPRFADAESASYWIVRQLTGSRVVHAVRILTASKTINEDLPWRLENGRPAFSYADYGNYEEGVHVGGGAFVARPFQVGIKGTLKGPGRAKPGDVREFDLPYPSAGLPSLGKKRQG